MLFPLIREKKMMRPRIRTLAIFLPTLIGLFFLTSMTFAAKPIAKITRFEGAVIIQTKTKIFDLKKVGQTLMDGDRVQTKKGKAEIVFGDGAVMKISPWSSALINEREEESGWWLWKSKKAVRRLTVFVGKLWFKSGASKRKNYLQTPTAVCGLRGTEGWAGFNNIESMLTFPAENYETIAGVWRQVRAVFESNPTITGANTAYTGLDEAKAAFDAAATDQEKASIVLEAFLQALDGLSDDVKDQISDFINEVQELKEAVDAGEVTVVPEEVPEVTVTVTVTVTVPESTTTTMISTTSTTTSTTTTCTAS